MSSGHYCVIRDLGLVKGGKGLRHHEVVLDLSWRGVFQFTWEVAKSALRPRPEPVSGEEVSQPTLVPEAGHLPPR